MKMKENETLNDFSTRFSELVNQMKTYGEDISDSRIVEKILISLPEKFDAIVAVVEKTKEISKLSIQELMGSLKSYEQRLSRHSEKSLESGFQSKLNFSSKNAEKKSSTQEQSKGESYKGRRQGRGRGRNWRGRGRYSSERKFNDEESSQRCNICKRSSHVEKDCWFRGKPQCHNCKRFGHVQKDCRIKINQQASFTEEKEDATWNWEKEKVQRKAVFIDVQQQKSASEVGNNGQESAPSSPSSTPPSSPTSSPSSSSSSSSSSPTSTPRKMRSLTDIYERFNFCVVESDCFKEAVKEKA
ncbi:hypothetical protein F0562_001596 [Nyssa sinensis]|uniref:CCHC-type domain-containing protein n=1 Tax=Nyssa sinensis TaxID=561372 RepID=A0A5J5C7L6_9ASTE|nr:hypothetical protein F0562_001596 [Nyssa sinensis]